MRKSGQTYGEEVMGADRRCIRAVALLNLKRQRILREERRAEAARCEIAACCSAKYGGVREERVRLIENPHAALGVDLSSKSVTTARSPVVVNVRETPVEHLFARGEIDARLKKAADWFRSLCEAMRIGFGVVDPARLRVDTSGVRSDPPDRAIAAAQELAVVERKLGMMHYEILVDACAVGLSMQEICRRWYGNAPEGSNLERECRKHIGQSLKDALHTVAMHAGITEDAKASGKSDTRRSRFYRAFSGLDADPRAWNAQPPNETG